MSCKLDSNGFVVLLIYFVSHSFHKQRLMKNIKGNVNSSESALGPWFINSHLQGSIMVLNRSSDPNHQSYWLLFLSTHHRQPISHIFKFTLIFPKSVQSLVLLHALSHNVAYQWFLFLLKVWLCDILDFYWIFKVAIQ